MAAHSSILAWEIPWTEIGPVMQLMCLRSKSILYTLLCDVRAGFCKQGFLASGFLLLCDKGGTQRTTELEEKGEWSFFPFFFFVSWALVNITRASFPQSDRGTSFFTEAIELVCRFSSFCRIRFHCVPLRHQQLSLSIPSEKSESLLCGGSPLQIQTPGLVRSILSSEM